MAEVKRSVRVAERLREVLSSLLLREVKDPRVANAIISRVQISDDLRFARVYFRLLEGGDDEERQHHHDVARPPPHQPQVAREQGREAAHFPGARESDRASCS